MLAARPLVKLSIAAIHPGSSGFSSPQGRRRQYLRERNTNSTPTSIRTMPVQVTRPLDSEASATVARTSTTPHERRSRQASRAGTRGRWTSSAVTSAINTIPMIGKGPTAAAPPTQAIVRQPVPPRQSCQGSRAPLLTRGRTRQRVGGLRQVSPVTLTQYSLPGSSFRVPRCFRMHAAPPRRCSRRRVGRPPALMPHRRSRAMQENTGR